MKNERKNNKNTIMLLLVIGLIIVIGLVMFIIFRDKITKQQINGPEILEPKSPVINFTDRQNIPIDDLEIIWSECNGADKYIYNIIMLCGLPENKDNEADSEGNITLAKDLNGTENRKVVINKNSILPNKWIKIAVASHYNDDKTYWKSIYVYVCAQEVKNNVSINVKKGTPILDGVIDDTESIFKIHSVDYESGEFLDSYDLKRQIKADFYLAWDDNLLYAAWEVKVDSLKLMPQNIYPALLWQYTCMQIMLSPGAPDANKNTYQKYIDKGNYLEIGVGILSDEQHTSYIWSYPDGVKAGMYNIDCKTKYNKTTKTLTYEIIIPSSLLGFDSFKTSDKIGCSYALSNQENFNEQPCMLEWQDSVLGLKNMDAGAILTLID